MRCAKFPAHFHESNTFSGYIFLDKILYIRKVLLSILELASIGIYLVAETGYSFTKILS